MLLLAAAFLPRGDVDDDVGVDDQGWPPAMTIKAVNAAAPAAAGPSTANAANNESPRRDIGEEEEEAQQRQQRDRRDEEEETQRRQQQRVVCQKKHKERAARRRRRLQKQKIQKKRERLGRLVAVIEEQQQQQPQPQPPQPQPQQWWSVSAKSGYSTVLEVRRGARQEQKKRSKNKQQKRKRYTTTFRINKSTANNGHQNSLNSNLESQLKMHQQTKAQCLILSLLSFRTILYASIDRRTCT